VKWKVRFAKARALGWVVATLCALRWFPHSVVFVVIASGYANALTDWSVAEASDESVILDRLDALEDGIS